MTDLSFHHSPDIKLSDRQVIYFALNGQLPAFSGNYLVTRNIKARYSKLQSFISSILVISILLAASTRIFQSEAWSILWIADNVKFLLIPILFIFILEYLLRLWTAPDSCPDLPENNAEFEQYIRTHHYRLFYGISFLGLIDLLVILSGLFTLISGNSSAWEGYLIVFALLKLSRYIHGIEIIAAVLKKERQILSATFITLAILIVILSTILYLVERNVQPEVFNSIPSALWWGIVTMTTTGYGDIIPMTSIGRVIGGVAMLVGIGTLAIPAGILASGFAYELKHREQLNNWHIISNLELFAGLDANCIKDITHYLKAEVLPAGATVFKKHSAPDAIYFIADGEVEIQIFPKPPTPIRLRSGDVFGEAGLLENRKRNASIKTTQNSRFLVLDLHDFHTLISKHVDLKNKIESINNLRKSSSPDSN
ncbi:cyclic nucleotide-gated ion channel [Polynucleobacter antarcticus]|uniref:Cyclic nucleotide-binding domain-containing protein n=1 Tax=Polynucleobacter antarcticus TaxID=1743162 RepID=A0A6M9Q1P2_9BURK|nr:cyclic nucleotide-gated ion channel [Polynucleobacter antarcticus]QKM62173.1 hypothetical protein DCO16_03220 [Polynucleobacter antarcticus]